MLIAYIMTAHILDYQAISEKVREKHHINNIDYVMETTSRYCIYMLRTYIYGFTNYIINKNITECGRSVLQDMRISKEMIVDNKRIAYETFMNNTACVSQYMDSIDEIDADAKGNIIKVGDISKMRSSANMLLSTVSRFVEYYYD